MLTKEAFNALLKTLEEPPPHAIFVLATTEPDRVPETVRSRCQRFDFRRIPTNEIVEHLAVILKAEGSQADTEALVAIARRSTGSMRDAVSLLDQLLSYGDERLTLARVEGVLGLVNAQTIGRLVDCLASNDAAAGLALINQLVFDGVELGQLVDQIVAYLRGVLFARVARAPEQLDLPQDVVSMMARQAETLSPAAILAALREFTEARAALRDQVPGVPQLPLEMAFLRATLAISGTPAAGVQPTQPMALPPRAAPTGQPTPPAGTAAETARPARPSEAAPTGAVPRTAPPEQTAAKPATGSSQPAPPADADLLTAAQVGWDRFIKLAGQRCGMKVQAALRGVKQLDVTGGTLIMQFSHAFSRDQIAQGENRVLVEGVWQEVLGRKVGVRCTLAGEAPAATSGASPPTEKVSSAVTAADDDDVLLNDARKLGAVVKPLSQKP
jgi:DNA polymerase-3 subunit gamma/tau